MTKEQLYTLLQEGRIDKLKEVLSIGFDIKLITDAIKQYDPKQHEVHDPTIRKDVLIYKESKTLVDSDGNPALVYEDTKEVQRIAAPLQEQIVLVRSAFVGTPKMTAKAEKPEETDLVQLMRKVWHDNKLDYRFNETKQRTMSELRTAWLFYNVEDNEYWNGQPIKKSAVKPRVKLLSHELGDLLYPVYDLNDDMIAFAREYTIETFDDKYNLVKEEHLDIYTNERIYYKKKVVGVWGDAYAVNETAIIKETLQDGTTTTSYKQNLVGKIPIIYFHQPRPEWSHVQDACSRIDELLSNHADTNDYFGNPILFGFGEGLSMPQKGLKYVEGKGDKADLKFVTWDNAPESVKMELQNLFSIVYDLSNTANISFENMKGLGPMSGFAIQLMFLGSTLKAKDCEMSIFGEGIQRAYNYMKKLISVLDGKFVATLSFQITPEFGSVLPNNITELLDNINKAKNGGIMSAETAIEQNPLITDADTEKTRIGDERDAAQAKEIDKQKQLSAVAKPFVPASN